MENLAPELLINKDEENKNISEKEIIEDKTNPEDIEKKGEFSTNFAEEFDLTEEEKKLRKNYLKKITKKEALWRSIKLGKRALYLRIYSFLMEILREIVDFQETKNKSDAINAITTKDLDKFISSIKYLIYAMIISKILQYIDTRIYNLLTDAFTSKNIMLENFLFKKDIEFFDLYKTGELFNKVNEHCDYPYFNIIDTFTKSLSYTFKIGYFGYYLFKDYFSMGLIYTILILLQYLLEPYINSLYETNEDVIDKREMKDNYINDILSNIRLIKSFGTEEKELKRVNNIQTKIKEASIFYKIINEFYQSIFSINEIVSLYICGFNTITGKMNYGELLLFQKYSGEFSLGISTLKGTITSISEGINEWIKFLQYYDIEQKIISEKNLIPVEKEKKIRDWGLFLKMFLFLIQLKKILKLLIILIWKLNRGKILQLLEVVEVARAL